MHSKNFTNKKQNKIFSKKQKGFSDGLSYSTPQKSEETRGNAITQPRSHPIFYIFYNMMGPRLGNGIFEGWSMTGHPQIIILFRRKVFASCIYNYVSP